VLLVREWRAAARRTAVGDANGRTPDRRGPGKRPPRCSECWDYGHANLGYGASWSNLLRFGIAVELADEPVAIFGGALGKIVDESFDLVSASISEGGGPAIIGRISLHEASIEPVLADQEAEAVAE